jgi:hypothetical protein
VIERHYRTWGKWLQWWLSNRHADDVDTSPNRCSNVVDSQNWLTPLFHYYLLSFTLVVVVEVKSKRKNWRVKKLLAYLPSTTTTC